MRMLVTTVRQTHSKARPAYQSNAHFIFRTYLLSLKETPNVLEENPSLVISYNRHTCILNIHYSY